ncbi:hypothetical protein MM239_14825 [Belliella sp. DSM 111904]|uniref:Uncharacterized protein n=1 Tax=Belliella filtrata TaxID=2923435 RepID=A0ABS9V391_9BACT|nr:hypothetical protein [Belliella filtrata]MCH7410679.1 hypothetical protein [Belliella filtrata]
MNLRNRILNFEHWISSDFKLPEPVIYQRELLKLFSENKDAFFYYRNWLFTLLLNRDEQDALAEFKNILDFKVGTPKHDLLLKHFLENNSSEIFSQKRLNAFEIALQAPNTDLNQNTCFLYQQYYEIEIIFLILYSFITLNDKDTIETDLNNFRDKNGNLRKGVLIDNLKSKLKPYPLTHKIFETAYNSKIRNIIGHNNYKIVGDTIESLEDNTIKLSKVEVFKSIYSIQSLNNYLLNYFSGKSIPNNDLQNAGILGMAFGLEGELPVLNIFQLSCFFHLGDFQWADKIIFSIRNNELQADFGFQSPMIGPYFEELEQVWFNPLRENKKLRIYLTPIVPRDEEVDFITLDVGEFIVTEDGKPIDLEYEINKYEP